ncbi:MAG TPA: phosphotriesterase-related protein [Dehalococcoidia bacterium]|nr:phosphotriesterase-related protein [Dehalococcoidia bacterium]
MPTVSSVAGPLDTADLGFTLMHEHIMVQSPGVKENFPIMDRRAEIESAVQKLKDVMARGVQTLVDLTPADWRDMPFVKEVVAGSGMQVIVATGIYWEVPHYFRTLGARTVDHIAGLFVRDIQEGIMDNGVRAGIIKCASDETGVTDDVERILRASARAHRATGVPISTHTHAASRVGLKQQDVFESEGADLSRVIIGHSGDSEDLDYLRRLMDRGSCIGMDRFGLDQFLPTEKRVATIARLCQMGYAEKMVLSHDASCYFDWADAALIKQFVPNWHFNYIPDEIVPALRAAGVAEQHIAAMTVDTPRRIFERQGAY